MKGLTSQTALVFDDISKMNCLKDLTLCGGTAISLQLEHRLSEDLDFELLSTKNNSLDLNFGGIINEINAIFPGSRREILSNEHFLMFLPQNVKLSFYKPGNKVPSLRIGYVYNNIKAPVKQELLGHKIFTTGIRSCFRDYYDIYCLLKSGADLFEGIKFATEFSRHSLHTKSLIQGLISPQLYVKEKDFDTLFQTRYSVSSEEICERIKSEISIGQKILIKR